MSTEPLGIYVHWPFCAAKCPYCDFNSHVRARIEEDRWIRAIASELEFVASELAPGRATVSSIFFGGGTPSLMSGAAVGATLDRIARHWPVADDVEITLEANPSSVDAGRFRDYRDAGVNRVSLGVQALNDSDLENLGRLHNAAEARSAVRLAAAVFERVSIDLIYGRPDQSIRQWERELQEAIALGTDHLSLYQLTIEEGTPFALRVRTGDLVPIGEPMAAELYEVTQAITNAAGLPAYEISNHARHGHECRHNLLYWRYGVYAGVGPGAHGRLPHSRGRLATATERLPERWLARVGRDRHGFVETTVLARADAGREHLLMNLRLSEGIDLRAYQAQWHQPIDPQRIEVLAEDGFVERRGTRLAVTEKGRLVLNAVIAALANADSTFTTPTPETSLVPG